MNLSNEKNDKKQSDNLTSIQKTLFVSIVGEPNAGKSTLLNRIAGQKISITTHKVQTTRENIRAIYTNEEKSVQLVFTDTPGIFSPNPKRKLEKHIVSNALSSIPSSDFVLVLIDAKRGISEYLKKLLANNEDFKRVNHKIAVINKIDEVKQYKQFELVDQIKDLGFFEDYFAISALKGHMVEDLVKYLESHSKNSPWIYDPDHITDTNVRTIAQEITREQVFLQLHRELPYSIKIETEKWEERETEVTIYQSIFVLKHSHKKIVLGKGGSKIKLIGQKSREEISNLLSKKVNLYLHVKVRENWIDEEFRNF